MQDTFPCKYLALNSRLLSLIEEFGGALGISWIWGEKKASTEASLISEEAKCLFRGVTRSPCELLSQTPQVSLGVSMDQLGIIPSIPNWALLSAFPLSLSLYPALLLEYSPRASLEYGLEYYREKPGVGFIQIFIARYPCCFKNSFHL